MTDEDILRAHCAPDPAAAVALDRLLSRLAAAEKVCGMIKTNLSPKLRQAAPKKLHWWDVGAAVKEWEERCE